MHKCGEEKGAEACHHGISSGRKGDSEREREELRKVRKQTVHETVLASPLLSVMTVNVNRSNSLIKRLGAAERIRNQTALQISGARRLHVKD